MSTVYYPTIGLEVHAELKTATKMFCGCRNDSDEVTPNVNVCPICMGHPGTLPTVNEEALKHVLRVGVAVGGTGADFTEFDRKNYFYPDIPKGYQISQYKFPLVSGGTLASVALTRVHLEEDTARSSHEEGEYSLVDYNRAGVPLMELVTEPVIYDAATAVRFAKELQLLLRTIGVGEANMEKGEMRVEANISISKDPKKFGTKVEVKNLNSFRSVERAIAYEIERHTAVLESGGVITQETRGWDDSSGKTYSQRKKEQSHDYRYFPEPDIPKFQLAELPHLQAQNLQKVLPLLPWEKRARYEGEYGLKKTDAEFLVADPILSKLFDATALLLSDTEEYTLLANYIVSDLAGLIKAATIGGDIGGAKGVEKELSITPKNFADLVRMIKGGEVSSRGAKDILRVLFEEGCDPKEYAKENNLLQQNDEVGLGKIAEQVIVSNPSVVTEYRNGKQAAIQFLIGQAMKLSRGSGNPALFREILIRQIGSSN